MGARGKFDRVPVSLFTTIRDYDGKILVGRKASGEFYLWRNSLFTMVHDD